MQTHQNEYIKYVQLNNWQNINVVAADVLDIVEEQEKMSRMTPRFLCCVTT